jgi:hypothetical protein
MLRGMMSAGVAILNHVASNSTSYMDGSSYTNSTSSSNSGDAIREQGLGLYVLVFAAIAVSAGVIFLCGKREEPETGYVVVVSEAEAKLLEDQNPQTNNPAPGYAAPVLTTTNTSHFNGTDASVDNTDSLITG